MPARFWSLRIVTAQIGGFVQRKFQVFVSSTFTDLVDERQDTIKSILDLGHLPAGMEAFPAADEEQFSFIKKVIDECDYYVLIIGARYGSVDDEGVSFTQKEYNYAVASKKTVLAFIHGDPSSMPAKKWDADPALKEKLSAFRDQVATGRLVQFWHTREQLETKVLKALHKAFTDYPGVGWIRGDAVATEELLLKASRLQDEVEALRKENSTLKNAARPKVDNVAGLDDDIIINFTYKSPYARQTLRAEVSVAWARVFVTIADELNVPLASSLLKFRLAKLIENLKGKELHASSIEIDNTSVVRIKYQLEALGLIRSFVAANVSGVATEFAQITDKGRSILMEMVVQRK